MSNKKNRDVTIVDYDRGNLFSIAMAVKHVGGNPIITNDPTKIINADRLILAGVGAFGDAMSTLDENGLSDAVREFVNKGNPLLGICLGMQLLFSESYEFGHHKGLVLVPGKVIYFKDLENMDDRLKIPHIGWNNIEQASYVQPSLSGVLSGGVYGANFYFVHSYICIPEDNKYIAAETEYGAQRFCSVVNKDNIWGCQFHPEKSGMKGLKIYDNFINNND